MSGKICSVEGCGGKHNAKGLCRKHYHQTPEYKACDKARSQTPEYKARDLMRKYGITPQQYEDALAAQGGVCWICEKPETRRDKRTGAVSRLAVDHCHETGINRGLLCAAHNTAIGLFKHDIGLLREAIKYLEQFGSRDAESATTQTTQTEEIVREAS